MANLKQFHPKILHGNGKILEILEEILVTIFKMLLSFCRKKLFLRQTTIFSLETDFYRLNFYPSLPSFIVVDADAVYFSPGIGFANSL